MNNINARDFNKRQIENQNKLMNGPKPNTFNEKELFTLKYLRYSIRWGSWEYRSGFISSLDRSIRRVEKSIEEDKAKEEEKK